MPLRSLTLTGEQIRAGRALARIEQAELAKLSSLSLETIKRLERIRGPVDANVRTLAALVAAFQGIGVYFDRCEDGGVGVCRPPENGDGARRPPRPRLVPTSPGPSTSPGGPLQRLIYTSVATPAVLDAMRDTVNDILRTARDRNAQLHITGALMVCDGRFLQALEGPKEAVQQVYGAVSADRRHTDLRIIENRSVASRQFNDWALCCGVFPEDRELFAQEPAMQNGFQPQALTPASALGLLSIVSDLQQRAPRNRRGEADECPLAEACLDCACAVSLRRPAA